MLSHKFIQTIAGLLLATAPVFKAAAADTINIVTDIAPIHSLVSMVVGDRANVSLLVPASQSPHTFSLKPSQVRSINRADAIITLSNDFTPSLGRQLTALSKNAVVIQLNNANQQHLAEAHSKDDHAHIAHSDDMHTWLNPQNAIEWIDDIAAIAINLDREAQPQFLMNATQAKAELTQLHESLQAQLVSVQSAPYIVYHDAYQHFAKAYGLRPPAAIALSDARAPGAARIRSMSADAANVVCVFSEVLHDDAIVEVISAGHSVKRGILDPIGSTQKIGATQYSNTMRALAQSFVECLSPS